MSNRNPFYRPPDFKQHELTHPERLVSFMIGGRAVPWKVPDVRISRRGGSYTEKNERLIAWQESVNQECRAAWGYGRKPYEGPVGISLWFFVYPPCKRALKTADVTNLVKSTEDGLQGVVIKNDTQVFAQHNERVFVPEHELQRAWVEVWATPREWLVPESGGEYGYRPWEFAAILKEREEVASVDSTWRVYDGTSKGIENFG